MTTDQALLFGLLAAVLGLLLSGRVRHDLVALAGLLTAVVLGLVPEDRAFEGFSSHAVMIVALVLIASRAFENSGVLNLLGQQLAHDSRSTGVQIALTGGVGAALSAVINNVAALALLMPLDVQTARRAGRPPGATLMPLAFATILGGMVTLIGTPPNIVASAVRAEQLGAPYRMFDFTPVGLAVAVAGLAFIALIGWRLVPRREDATAEWVRPAPFMVELPVPAEAPIVGRPFADLDDAAEQADVLVVGLVRDGRRHHGRARVMTIQDEDVLIVEGATDSIAAFIKTVDLQERQEGEGAGEGAPAETRAGGAADDDDEEAPAPEIVEAVVRADSRLAGRSARAFDLRARFGLTLLGIARAGRLAREQVRDRTIEAGDVLLLTGRRVSSPANLESVGLIAIDRVSVAPFRPREAALTIGLFAGAIGLASAGLLSFTVALAIAVAVYAAIGLVPARELYQQIDWPVVVMLACLLPLGTAFAEVGGTALIAGELAQLAGHHTPELALIALMVVTMTLSDALNNVATMVIAGPIAIDLAERLAVNPDTFLMGVAVACSCAFLTPIGHKNNTLIMGPGGFRFGDYWRMGLPLELVVLAVGVPMLLVVWPL